MVDADTDRELRLALRTEYETARDAVRPDGVAAVHAAAGRNRRRRLVVASAVAAVLVLGTVAGWRLAASNDPPQRTAANGCDRPGTGVSVFLTSSVTDEQRTQVRTTLEKSTQVYCLTYRSRDEAYERFKRDFSEAPDLTGATSRDSFPDSFHFRVSDPAEVQALKPRITPLAGVDEYICDC